MKTLIKNGIIVNSNGQIKANVLIEDEMIVKCDKKELPDKTYEEAAALAAYYSKGRTYEKVEVDYVERKQLKKE